MRFMVLFALLLFEPIVIDEQTYQAILQSAHQNFRGPEYDTLMNILSGLERRAIETKAKPPEPHK